MASYRNCVEFDTVIIDGFSSSCGREPTAPGLPAPGTTTKDGLRKAPTITPAQAGALAVARLRLPTITPGIGPAPELNPWKMAAVGYPLWLWADGPHRIGPVSDSVAGLFVSLDARLSRVTYRMGDGHTLSCPANAPAWTRAIAPDTPSPSCGYRYAEPSLPDGRYTVAAVAVWSVTWRSNGQTGVIDVPAVHTTQLPVGELQVLNR